MARVPKREMELAQKMERELVEGLGSTPDGKGVARKAPLKGDTWRTEVTYKTKQK